MEYIAFDFETANPKRASACSIGIVRVVDHEIVEKKHWLIRPQELNFNKFNVRIHGITREDVIHEPTFDQLWPELKGYFDNKIVVAHNASFDISVLKNVLDDFHIPYPELQYACTCKIAKKLWPNFKNHKLNTLANIFNIELKHHDALDDALACAKIASKACQEIGVNCLLELSKALNLSSGYVSPEGHKTLRQIG